MRQGTVVITASTGSFPDLAERLRRIAVAVEEHPLLSFAPPLDWRPVDDAVGRLDRFESVAITSPRAARAFRERLVALGVASLPEARPSGARAGGAGQTVSRRDVTVWASGSATADELGGVLGPARIPDAARAAELGSAAELARAMLEAGVRGPVLFPCGEIRREELPARLRQEGIEVEEVVCYRSVLAAEAEARSAAERGQIVIVASPSVADLLARACPAGKRPALLAVGPTTARAARVAGWPPAAVAAHPSSEALVARVQSLLASR